MAEGNDIEKNNERAMGFKFLQRSGASSSMGRRRGSFDRHARFVLNSQKPFESKLVERALHGNRWSDPSAKRDFDVQSMRRDISRQRNQSRLGDSQKYLRQAKQLIRSQNEAKKVEANFRTNFPMLPLPGKFQR